MGSMRLSEEDGVTIAEVLSAERDRLGLTYQAVGDRCGLPVARVHEVLSGKSRKPSLETVRKITAGLGKSLCWLERKLKQEITT